MNDFVLYNSNKEMMMKYLNWFVIGTALALCLTLVAPPVVQAATKQRSSEVQKSSSSKTEKKSVVKSTARSSKKSKVEKKSDKKNKSEKIASKSKKSKQVASKENSSKKSSQPSKSSDNREVWMERAKDSEILTGQASWYGKDFHKKATASGLDYDMHTFTAAHRTLPIGTIVKVTDQKRGNSVMVCVTDRGPYVRGRIIDLSYAAAKKLDLVEKRGVCRVNLEVISDEKGQPLKPGQAYFVRYGNKGHKDKVGPFKGFADAAAMHEALRQAHPDAEVVLDSTR